MSDETHYFDGGEDEDGYEVLVPFVCVESMEGPFEDESFVNGFQVGRLWEMLRSRLPLSMWFDARLAGQLGLVAGHHRMSVELADEDEADGPDFGLRLFHFAPLASFEAELAAVLDGSEG